MGLVKIGNNINVDNNGVISINDGNTSSKGVIQLTDSTSSTSITTAATPNSVKSAYDLANTEFTGATSESNGIKGIVPAPSSSDRNKFLKADGTWAIPEDTTYVLPAATSETLGGIKIGSNISIGSNDEIYISNANALSALNKGTDTTKYLRNDGTWEVPPNTTYNNATTDTAGLMSSSDKAKLDNIDFNANNYSLPNATSSDKGGVIIGSNITVNEGTISINDGSTSTKGVIQLEDSYSSTSITTAATPNSVKAAYDLANTEFTGATINSNGIKGIVPQPLIADKDKFLKADGTWATPQNDIYTHPIYTITTGIETSNQIPDFGESFNISQVVTDNTGHVTSQTTRTVTIPNSSVISSVNGSGGTNGLMLSTDKEKLDNIENNANKTIVDSSMSDNSTNPVQNKVIKKYVDDAVIDLVNNAPEELDTLKELADYLTDDTIEGSVAKSLSNKVDKISGKGLSTNDFTNNLKTKLDNIDDNANNYIHPTYTAVSGKPSANETPSFGSTFTVTQINSDTSGHVSLGTDRTIKIPDNVAVASTSGVGGSNGLMSATDKEKLSGIADNANNYTHPSYTSTIGIESSNQTPGFGSTFNISQVISDNSGHISSQTTRTVKIPDTTVTASVNGSGGNIGLMTAIDKEKLDGIANNANNYTHPTQSAITGNPSSNQTPNFGSTFTVSQVSVNTLGHVTSLTDRTIKIPNTEFVGATIESSGSIGLVPAPLIAEKDKYLKGDGTWGIPENTVYIHPTYTATTGSESSNQTPDFGDTFNVSQIISDSIGHITSQTTRTVKIPDTKSSTSAFGIIKVGTGLDISEGIISHPSGISKTGNPLSDQTPSFGGSFTVTQFTSNSTGHISAVTDRTITIPSTKASSDNLGLVKIGDNITSNSETGAISISNDNVLNALNKGIDTTKYLRNDGSWAVPYTHPTQAAITGKPTSNVSVNLGTSFTISQPSVDTLGHTTNLTDRTVTINHPTYTATTGIESSNQTPSFGSTFSISQIITDGTGHVTSQTTRTITIPNTVATQLLAGLMSAEDKIKLDSLNLNRAAYVTNNSLLLTGGAFVAQNE